MKTILILWTILALAATTTQAGRVTPDAASEPRIPVFDGEGVILTSNSSANLAARETAGPDTFALFGGPGEPVEGKFQLSNTVTPDWGDGTGNSYTGAPGQWTPVDLTDLPVFWHRSQFNAQTLGTSQPSPNHAIWCGVDVSDPYGENWANLPGYGNNWRDRLVYESAPLADPTVSETVSLDFFFHHDTEPAYDYFSVEYDSAGTWMEVLSIDGTDADSLGFHPPGVQFTTVQTAPIDFSGNDFGGQFGDQIVIRMVVTSDAVWSDEDGLWPTQAGAAQVDEISLTTSQGSFTEDFEGAGPYLFTPDKAPFAGDFAEVYPFVTDLDPCRDNSTPVMGFVDTGQIIRNGPGLDGTTHISGGSVSPGVNYGVPGNYVVNYTGGLSFGAVNLTNEVWSPDILWDLPGTDDDDVGVSGAEMRVSVWMHMPLINGMFYLWHVRSALPGEPYGSWDDRNFVYFADGVPQWANYSYDVTDLIQPSPERVQMAFAVWDFASVFAFPGTASTPAPFLDNAAFYKYRIGGPTFASRTIDTANDGFPVNGSIDVSTPASRDALDIPFDMARDVNTGDLLNTPGDSVIVDVASVIPGASVMDIRMVWALETNALFEDALRSAPSRPKDENVVAGPAGTTWTGEVVADTSTVNGVPLDDRFFFDLPDQDFMYPGDVLHYYIQATDSDGRTTTLPDDTTDFLDFSSHTVYSRTFTVRGLPSIRQADGTQPELLVWNDFGRRGGEDEWLSVFYGRGLIEGLDFDSYTTQGPSSQVSNGLGSAGAHGANADQLAAYEHIIYLAENLSTGLLSNGSNDVSNDKSNDIGVLEQWHALPGARNVVYFGDYIATALIHASPEGATYLINTMGVRYGDSDVRDVIGDQVTPLVVPDAGGAFEWYFNTDFIAFGGCLGINQFDQIQPLAGAAAGHLFTDPSGTPYPPHPDPRLGGVASVINPTANGYDVTFPIGFSYIYTPATRGVVGSARELVLLEVLSLFNYPLPIPNDTPSVPVPVSLSTYPNPFNPVTTVSFTARIGSRGSVKVYNLRGELVTTLHTGEFQVQEFSWDGTDARGASVASGVYVVQAESEGKKFNAKVALVK